ncbi:hypothetical protein A3Q56_06023 [Intoshia linei]|uniref:Sulfatase N-terminal domain-containing protein n=1 Tax=Intoshia linei TaxID=1819745 RepID=A0A177AWD4_9BILA|nr:hypothetical protein A3Q56_06023 [Intoshia linei]
MYFAYPTPHTPLESESKFYNMYNESKMSEQRKHYLALMTLMDHSVGNLVSSLKAEGMYHNSIIIFTSDNGGEIFGPSSNYPYRGSKLSLYEGGVRSTAFVHSPLYDIDGYDLSDVLSNEADSPRKEVVLNIDLITLFIAGAAGINDPREKKNMVEEFPKKVTELQQALIKYKKQFIIEKIMKIDPRGFPENNGGNWIPGWCDINEFNAI